jgi:hypothetical protein
LPRAILAPEDGSVFVARSLGPPRDRSDDADLTTLQERAFYGKERKSLACVKAIMNMIPHGLEAPNIFHTIKNIPFGAFQGAGVNAVVFFFDKGTKTRNFVKLRKPFADSPKSWSVDARIIGPATSDLSVNNPNVGKTFVHRSPQDMMDEIVALDADSAPASQTIQAPP